MTPLQQNQEFSSQADLDSLLEIHHGMEDSSPLFRSTSLSSVITLDGVSEDLSKSSSLI